MSYHIDAQSTARMMEGLWQYVCGGITANKQGF